MRHTLLPLKERLILRREYRIRTAIVLLYVLSTAALVGVASLFPAYLHAWSSSREALAQVASAKADPSRNNLVEIQKVLASDDALLVALGGGTRTARFSDAIESIVGVHSPVTILSFAMSRMATSTIVASLSGMAPTRNDLLGFKSRLEGLVPGATVELPIEELAKSVNVPFSIQFSANMP